MRSGRMPAGTQLELHGGFHAPPKVLTPAVEAMLGHLKTCGEMIGVPVGWRPTGGASDGNRLAAAGLPVVDSLGVRGGNIHRTRNSCTGQPGRTGEARGAIFDAAGGGEIFTRRSAYSSGGPVPMKPLTSEQLFS